MRRQKGVLDPVIPVMEPVLKRGPRNFDGNNSKDASVIYWLYVDRLLPGDFEMLANTDSLGWVIVPLPEPI